MISEKELQELIKDMESDRVERTISFREEKLGEAVCAFSNDLPNHKYPGYLLIGIEDKTGKIAGLTITDKDLQKLGDIRSNGNILPQPFLVVSPVFHFLEGDVVALEVHPADFPPVRYKGKCCIRVGPRKGTASPQEERTLSEKRISTAKNFDALPCKGSSLNELDIDLFKISYLPSAIDDETLQANHRTTKEQLASLGFYDLVTDCCTNAGILLFGVNPRFYLSGAYIQYVKFDSQEMDADTVVTEKEFSGDLMTILKNIDDFVTTNIVKNKSKRKEGFRQKYVSNYPSWSLRELMMNALMHRDYESNAPVLIYEFEDRIEIINPGGLYGDARPENFPNASDYRNPIIAGAMKVLGYVNRFNFGVANAQKHLKENGNPPAKFKLELRTKFFVSVGINQEWYA